MRKIIVALGAFFLISNGAVLASAATAENYSDIIEKANNLSLQKDRAQAIVILVGAVRKEGKHSAKAQKDLVRALEQITHIFYSDRTQQLYELGISLRLSDPTLANQKLTEALKLEPDNLLAQLGQLRIQMMLGDCSGALSGAKKLKEVIPFLEEIDLVLAQAAVCAGQFETYQQVKLQVLDPKGLFYRHWASAEMESLFKNALFQRGSELAINSEKLDPLFPESFYWHWKMQMEMKTPAEVSATKYLNLCKSLSARSQRDYLAEPQLCRRTTEVESFLKKNNSTGL